MFNITMCISSSKNIAHSYLAPSFQSRGNYKAKDEKNSFTSKKLLFRFVKVELAFKSQYHNGTSQQHTDLRIPCFDRGK